MQHHSAEVTAAVNFVRYGFTAGASAFALPMIVRSPILPRHPH